MADMFAEIVRPATPVGAKRWYTVPLSIAAHAAVLAIVVAVPLLATGALPPPPSVIVFTAPMPPTPPEMPRAPAPPPSAAAAVQPALAATPIDAPATLGPEPPPTFAIGSVSNAGLPPGLSGVDEGLVWAPPPMIPPPAPTPSEPVRPGGQIKNPVKVYDVSPAYPSIALHARVSGVVVIDATIDTDGRVIDAAILRSIPLLDRAALDAVRQWRYRPTLLNGTPIAIRMTVTVVFALK